MKNFIETLGNIWKIKELRGRILFTLGLLAVYRLGSFVPLPGVDEMKLIGLSQAADANGLLGLLNSFTGGAFAHAAILGLGVMPYISASIVVQLMAFAVPALQKLQKDGESGRKQLTQITRWLTIAIAAVQGFSYIGHRFRIPHCRSGYQHGDVLCELCHAVGYRYDVHHVAR